MGPLSVKWFRDTILERGSTLPLENCIAYMYDLHGLFVVMGLMIIWLYGNMAICQYGNMFTLKNIKFPNASGSFTLSPLAFSLLYSFETVMGDSQFPSQLISTPGKH